MLLSVQKCGVLKGVFCEAQGVATKCAGIPGSPQQTIIGKCSIILESNLAAYNDDVCEVSDVEKGECCLSPGVNYQHTYSPAPQLTSLIDLLHISCKQSFYTPLCIKKPWCSTLESLSIMLFVGRKCIL